MKASRFRFRVWVNDDIERDGSLMLMKGWLSKQSLWFQLSPCGTEIQWGETEEPEMPLIVGREVTVEFSTGLTDKNGKEIFEGDIVRAQFLLSGKLDIYEVAWEEVLASDDMGVNMIGFRTFDEYATPEVTSNIHEEEICS
jgi:uncharacterized phage protein (TIGR01671 family)